MPDHGRKPNNGVRVTITKDGPYLVSGGVPLAKYTIVSDTEGGSESWQQGKDYPPQASYALCRCGQSRNKPFCDGTHAAIKFHDD